MINKISVILFLFTQILFSKTMIADNNKRIFNYLGLDMYLKFQHKEGAIGTDEGYNQNKYIDPHLLIMRTKKVSDEKETLFMVYSPSGKIESLYIYDKNIFRIMITLYPGGQIFRYKEDFTEDKSKYQSHIYWDGKNHLKKSKVTRNKKYTLNRFCVHGVNGSYDCNKTTHKSEKYVYKTDYIDKSTYISNYKQKDKVGRYESYRKDGTLATRLTKISTDNVYELNLFYNTESKFVGLVVFKGNRPYRNISLYDNGKMKGYIVYHPNGVKKEVRTYHDDKDNHLKYVCFYNEEEIKNSVEKSYCKDGTLNVIQKYKNGKSLSKISYPCH